MRAIRLADGDDAGRVVDAVIAAAEREAEKPVLLISGDRFLLQACRHRDRLQAHLHLLLPPVESAETVVSKDRFRAFCEAHDVPVPRSWAPRSAQELCALAPTLRYPVVLKPVCSMDWHGAALVAEQGHIKMILAPDAPSLTAHWMRLAGGGRPALVQEYIGGGDSDHYSYVSYRDGTGRELAAMCVRKLRLHPIHGGLATLACCVEDAQMREVGRRVLQQLDYASVASVCFKRDPDTGLARIFEINGRLPLAHGALNANGVDLPWLMYRDAQGLPCEPVPVRAPGPARWLSLSHDIWAAREYRRCGELGWFEWLRSLRHVRYVLEFDPRDPGPFLWFLCSLMRIAAAALRRRLWGATS